MDQNGNVVNVGTDTTYAVTGLSNGNYVFGIEAFDNAGNSRTASVDFTVNITFPPSSPPEETETTEPTSNMLGELWIYLVAASAIVGVVAVGGFLLYRNRRIPSDSIPDKSPDARTQTKLTEEQREKIVTAIGKIIVYTDFRHQLINAPREALKTELGFEIDTELENSLKALAKSVDAGRIRGEEIMVIPINLP